MARRLVSILGSTGSIGESALDVVRASNGRLGVAALAAGSNWRQLAAQVREFRPPLVVAADPAAADELARECAGDGVRVASGDAGLTAAATLAAADIVLSAIVGAAGILPTLAAARAGKTIALANKESLVAAGGLITAAVRDAGGLLLPVDSEHNALFQLLAGRPAAEVSRLVLTASGGPFLRRQGSLAAVTPEEALRHPSWSMGAKVSIDSATLMNKGLEVIEAHWLFAVPLERIAVVIHPQSIVHGAIEMNDGALLAHLSPPDMRIPIAAALYHPRREALPWQRLDLAALGSLEFIPPDHGRFPALGLAYDAFARGGTGRTRSPCRRSSSGGSVSPASRRSSPRCSPRSPAAGRSPTSRRSWPRTPPPARPPRRSSASRRLQGGARWEASLRRFRVSAS
jgi:1-deoxy-D-xylulose-5-phosphate reductoisomerase